MIPGVDTYALALLVAAMLASGLLGGLLAGLLGVGGGIVMVPVLFQVFTFFDIPAEARMHLAVGTSLMTIVPTSIRSALGHYRKGTVDRALLRAWLIPVFLGVVAGAVLAGFVRGQVLSGVFAVVALAVGLQMALFREGPYLGDKLPRQPVKSGMAGFIGMTSTMMGIGGGTLTVPLLSLFRYPIRNAVGTAAAVGAVIAIPGSLGFILAGWGAEDLPLGSLGYVNMIGFLVLVPATLLAAPWGVRIAHRISPLALRRAFALFLFLTGARMAVALIGG